MQARKQHTAGFFDDFSPWKGKSVLELNEGPPPTFLVISDTAALSEPLAGSPSQGQFKAGSRLEYLDFAGGFVQVEGTMENGEKVSAWVKQSDTNFDPAELLLRSSEEQIDEFGQAEERIINQFQAEAVQDYNRLHPIKADQWGDLSRDEQLEYQDYGHHLMGKRIRDEIAAKQELAGKVIQDYEKFFALRAIFDPEEMAADMKNDPKDRKFQNNRFPDGGKMTLGYYPKISSGQDKFDLLNMGADWMATMEVLYDEESSSAKKGEPEALQVVLNFPLTKLISQRLRIAKGTDYSLSNEQLKSKMNLLAIMIAHEYLHSSQNTLRINEDISKLPGLDSDEKKKRKAMREILAYHFTAFPNKQYENPALDPVFSATNFVRGESARFGQVSSLETAFFIWKGFDYIRRLEKFDDKALEKKYSLPTLKKDFEEAAAALKTGPLAIEFDPESNELKAFFATQDPELDQDRKFMNYLHSKK